MLTDEAESRGLYEIFICRYAINQHIFFLDIPFHFTLPKEGELIRPVVTATPPLISQLKKTPRHSTPIGGRLSVSRSLFFFTYSFFYSLSFSLSLCQPLKVCCITNQVRVHPAASHITDSLLALVLAYVCDFKQPLMKSSY